MYYLLPIPIPLSMCGALAGLVGGGCNQFFPVWVGGTTGALLGCIISICMMVIPNEEGNTNEEANENEVVIQNPCITGRSKDNPLVKI